VALPVPIWAWVVIAIVGLSAVTLLVLYITTTTTSTPNPPYMTYTSTNLEVSSGNVLRAHVIVPEDTTEEWEIMFVYKFQESVEYTPSFKFMPLLTGDDSTFNEGEKLELVIRYRSPEKLVVTISGDVFTLIFIGEPKPGKPDIDIYLGNLNWGSSPSTILETIGKTIK
jgi:hypothetical protein